jgi:hypothetical protein
VVVADGVQGDLRSAVPLLEMQEAVAVWATPRLEEGGWSSTRRGRADQGYAWWSWLGRARTEAEAAERLFHLLGDPSLPATERSRLEQAVTERMLRGR